MSFGAINCSMNGVLYSGSETIKERGLKVGDTVCIGGGYSERKGKIVSLSQDLPFKAYVELRHANQMVTCCWIKSEYLL